MKSSGSRVVLFAVLALPLVVAGFVFGPAAFKLLLHGGPPQRFLIPEGYTGWVRIEFRIPGSPALPYEGARRVLKIGADGTLRTSSDPPRGSGHDDFYFYSGDRRKRASNAGVCRGGMIWGMEAPSDVAAGNSVRFFVGTEEAYRHEVDPAGNASSCE